MNTLKCFQITLQLIGWVFYFHPANPGQVNHVNQKALAAHVQHQSSSFGYATKSEAITLQVLVKTWGEVVFWSQWVARLSCLIVECTWDSMMREGTLCCPRLFAPTRSFGIEILTFQVSRLQLHLSHWQVH